MTADELEQIKHRAASCYVGTAWRGAIADVRKLIDAVDAMNLQLSEVPKKILAAVNAEQLRCGKIAEAFWNEEDKLNAGLRVELTQAEKNTAYMISTGIRAMRWQESNFTEKRVHLADDGVRVLDECGQVKCETLGCDVRHNPEWSDGTPRYGCSADGSTHEVENRKKRERK
jgi:hypothetical protein